MKFRMMSIEYRMPETIGRLFPFGIQNSTFGI